MAVPKSKLSSARKNSRRSSVWKMSAPTLVHCPKCGEYKHLTLFAAVVVLQRQRSN